MLKSRSTLCLFTLKGQEGLHQDLLEIEFLLVSDRGERKLSEIFSIAHPEHRTGKSPAIVFEQAP